VVAACVEARAAGLPAVAAAAAAEPFLTRLGFHPAPADAEASAARRLLVRDL
jgi:hypothetical protein